MDTKNTVKAKTSFSTPPSVEIGLGHGIWAKKSRKRNTNAAFTFRHSERVKRPKNLKATEIPKQVRNDKLYNASHCKSKCAFTLAEVLITLVIIGVIAALTIPNLMQKYTEQTTVKKVQKFYSNLSNAYSLAKKENGGFDEWGLVGRNSESAKKIYQILFKPYFKIAKDCGVNNTGNCIDNTNYKTLAGSTHYKYGTETQFYKIMLQDGAAVWMFDAGYTDNNIVIINYDANGIKEPNQYGKDLFDFKINKDVAYPAGSPKYDGRTSFKNNCNKNASGASGAYCAAWVVYKGNMDYLHCDGLDWNGKDKCK